MQKFTAPILSPVSSNISSSVWSQIKEWRFNERRWKLEKDWVFWCEYIQRWIKIPRGFVCDGASVPKILSNVVSSTDGLFYGAIVHDFIYRFDQLITAEQCKQWSLWEEPGKAMADKLLYIIPKEIEGFYIQNSIAYALKPMFYFAWKKWRKKGYKLQDPYPASTNPYLAES